MRRFRSACMLPALLAASGCLGPKPPLPAETVVEVPAAFRFAPGQAPVGAEWWRSFGDPDLDAVVQDALAHNPNIGEAVESVEQARAAEHGARANRFPEVDGQNLGGYTRSIGPPPAELPFSTPEVTASWDIDLFGKLKEADLAARANLLSTEGARDAVRLSIAGTAASGYITLLGLDAQLAILRRGVGLRTAYLQTARRRQKVGYTSSLELQQAEAEYESVVAMEPATELAIAHAEDALSILTGHPPRAIARAASGLDALAIPAVPGGLPSSLLERRPDIWQAEQAVISADHSLASARANMLPDFSLTGFIGEEFAQPLPHGEIEYLIASSVVGPLLDFGRRQATADQVAAQRNQAAYAYKSTVLGALRDVDDALSAIARDREQDGSLGKQADTDARYLRLARDRYRAGYSPYFDQIDAERQLLLAQVSLAQARTAWLNAYVSLYQALGGGWRAAGTAATPPASLARR